ncbi:sugar O-acetyltransferase [Thermophilibacter provencensis]|uniref:sugar O-acetyltransferase n=1 Tax=Thermophilibacter provencensis TaxID=1852386 RepID=UPI002941F1C5|nr:sugar O-acetyltransferase [Thermophilibacter provencensis]
MTEREKLERGLWYDANYDEDLCRERERANELAHRLNQASPGNAALRESLLRELLGHVGEHVEVLSPLYVDYGRNVSIGDWSFLNHGAYLMDGAPITIGSHVFVGPNLGAYTAQHPLVAEERNLGLERALPITIEDDVWIGGDVKIMPGVTIGRGSVIGAGSVVTRDVPAGVVAMGSPCHPVRPITDADRIRS